MHRLLYVEGSGLVGGRLLELEGLARLQETSGGLGLEIRVTGASLALDPALALLCCIDLLVLTLAATARPLRASAELPDGTASARLQAVVLEEGLRELGTIDAVGELGEKAGKRRLQFELLRATVAAEPGERLVSLGPTRLLARSAGEGRIAVQGIIPATTTRGRDWALVVTTMVEPAEVRSPAVEIVVEEFGLRREGELLFVDGKVRARDLHRRR